VPPSHPRARLAGLLLLGFGFCVPGAQAQLKPRAVALTIGPEWSVVREVYDVSFLSAELDVTVELPAEADLSSFNVVGQRAPVRLESWSVVPPVARPGPPTLQPGPRGYEVAGQAPGTSVAAGAQRVRCHLVSALRPRAVEVFYRTRGLSWQGRYEITIRGDVANYLEPLSLDLDGRVIISNGTAHTYRAAELVVVGPDPQEPGRLERSRAAPGLLMLDDSSPLADIWRHQTAVEQTMHVYPLAGRRDVPAGAETSVPLVTGRRKPAERLYSMDSEQFELGASGPWRALRRFLTFRNDVGFGLGQPLPAGTALIYLGAVRSALYQKAWIGHTPAQAEIRIDLGAAAGVTGLRRSEGRTVSPAGYSEETVAIQLANALPSAVKLEVVERPPVPLAWDVVRSSRPYEVRDRRLHYALQLQAREESDITYTVRLTEPEL
jgi:hypothetical protein